MQAICVFSDILFTARKHILMRKFVDYERSANRGTVVAADVIPLKCMIGYPKPAPE